MSISYYNFVMYIRARTKEQFDERKKEILDAMDSLYLKTELSNIYLKDIASLTKISRTAIYSYYKSKEEILLDSLYNHFILLDDDLESLLNKEELTKEVVTSTISSLFNKHVIILKIMSSDLETIERSTTLETLIIVKQELKRFQSYFKGICKKLYPNSSEKEIYNILVSFITMMYGFYSISYPINVQKEAMVKTNTDIDISLQDLITTSLNMLFNSLEN